MRFLTYSAVSLMLISSAPLGRADPDEAPGCRPLAPGGATHSAPTPESSAGSASVIERLEATASQHFELLRAAWARSLKVDDVKLFFAGKGQRDEHNAVSYVRGAASPDNRIVIGDGLLERCYSVASDEATERGLATAEGTARVRDRLVSKFIALVVAHEFAHQLQDRLMIGANYSPPTTAADRLGMELEADFIAGIWLANAYGWEGKDLGEALVILHGMANSPFNKYITHGLPPQRTNAARGGVQFLLDLKGAAFELTVVRNTYYGRPWMSVPRNAAARDVAADVELQANATLAAFANMGTRGSDGALKFEELIWGNPSTGVAGLEAVVAIAPAGSKDQQDAIEDYRKAFATGVGATWAIRDIAQEKHTMWEQVRLEEVPEGARLAVKERVGTLTILREAD